MAVLKQDTFQAKDIIVPFYLDHAHVKGRLVRLGNEGKKVVANHGYPDLVNQYISEVIVLAAVLSIDIKYDGIFTLQISRQPDHQSLIRLITVDINTQGHIRAYAQWDEQALKDYNTMTSAQPSLQEVFGQAYIVFTADLAQQGERYQAIVELQGRTLSDSMHHFFRQSDQVPTGLVLYSQPASPAQFIAGAVILQRLPVSLEQNPEQQEDDWLANLSLLGTLSKHELLDTDLSHEQLLYRLFHERNLRILEPKLLKAQCSCSLERIQKMLASFSLEDQKKMATEGKIEIVCEFCNTPYTVVI